VYALQLFFYLQLLDFMTTIVGFRLGGDEVSPFARWLTGFSPALGLAVAKVTAFAIAGVCIIRRKDRVIRWANYFFALLVVWNLGQILRAVS
jgi:hypothetical protein